MSLYVGEKRENPDGSDRSQIMADHPEILHSDFLQRACWIMWISRAKWKPLESAVGASKVETHTVGVSKIGPHSLQLGRLCEILFSPILPTAWEALWDPLFFPFPSICLALLAVLPSTPLACRLLLCSHWPISRHFQAARRFLTSTFFHRQSLTVSLPVHFNSYFFCYQIFDHSQVVLDDRCWLISLRITLCLLQLKRHFTMCSNLPRSKEPRVLSTWWRLWRPWLPLWCLTSGSAIIHRQQRCTTVSLAMEMLNMF